MNSRLSFALALCLVVVCLLGGVTQTFACPKGYSGSGHSCVPNPSSPSDETLNTKRFKPVKKLGVHPSSPSDETLKCGKGYTGTPPDCSLVRGPQKGHLFLTLSGPGAARGQLPKCGFACHAPPVNRRALMNSRWSFALALCGGVLCLLGGSTQTFACTKGSSVAGAFCVPNDNPESRRQ